MFCHFKCTGGWPQRHTEVRLFRQFSHGDRGMEWNKKNSLCLGASVAELKEMYYGLPRGHGVGKNSLCLGASVAR